MNLKTSLPHCTVFFLFNLLTSYGSGFDDAQYSNCSSHFVCGDTVSVTYPFWGEARPSYCGVEGFKLVCNGNISTFLYFEGQRYSILQIDERHRKLNISQTDLSYNVCNYKSQNTTILSHSKFHQTSLDKNLSIFYGCLDFTPTMSMRNEFYCPPYDGDSSRNASFFVEDAFLHDPDIGKKITNCRMGIKVAVLQSAIDDIGAGKLDLQGALKKGLEMKYSVNESCAGCEASGGKCGTKPSSADFVCYCRDKPHPLHCPPGGGVNSFLIAGLSVAATTIVGLLGMFLFLRYRRRRQPNKHPYNVTRAISSGYSSRTGLETSEASYYGLPLFEYEELREATNNFDPGKELGDGGFGTVFYGKLRDGRAVAVKRLYEHNYKRTAQFMNEVEILAKLHHPNLVHLYGCTSRQSHRLLLVYEYMPNGTVADHLHGDLAKPGSLPWLIRMNIAVETASALVYLHASDIIHRDVKTNNILLDENFKVKVADFGLSRLFPMNVTHVSTAPQGTPGYVDPEYNQCYQLTDKSDVYSFGVVLMELISSLPAVDIMRHRHEINLSTMAVNKIQSDALHELVDAHLGFELDSKTRRKIEAVAELGFRCLQRGKDMRPSMAEVLSTLQEVQKQGSEEEKVEEDESRSDDVRLLKVDPLMLSPDSVMAKWASMNPTPNTSA